MAMQDLRGHTVQFCRDQHGSRFIQQKLEVASDAEKSAFFEEVSAIISTFLGLQNNLHYTVQRSLLCYATVHRSIRDMLHSAVLRRYPLWKAVLSTINTLCSHNAARF
jgi:Pumilio-family RNA binding repeat